MRIFCAAILISTLFLGCTGKDRIAKNAFYTYHLSDIKSLDPAIGYDEYSWNIIPLIYETLYQYAYLTEPLKIVPLLAADMPKFSNNGLTVTIPILRKVKFQSDPAYGKKRELTAEDFIYAFKRLALPKIGSPGWWIFDEKVEGFREFKTALAQAEGSKRDEIFKKGLTGFQAPNKHTLVIKLKKPYPQLLNVLALPFTSPVAVEAIKNYGDENGALNEKPLGTGPFVLDRWERGHRITLKRNPYYHADFYPTEGAENFRKRGFFKDAGKTLPLLDQIIVDVIREAQPAWLNFLKFRLDNTGIPKDNFDQVLTPNGLNAELKEKQVQLQIIPEPTFFYVAFNMKHKLLGKNKALRQALSSAIDRDRLIQLFTNGRAMKATTVLPPGVQGRPEKTKIKYDFDLAKAKALLKKAGFPGGKGLPKFKFDMRGADSFSRQLGEFFVQSFNAINVPVQIVYNNFSAFLEKQKRGNLEISLGGWTIDYPDAENGYQLFYGPNQSPGPNDSNFNDPKMNSWYQKMSVMMPGPKRAALIKEMDDLIQEECPWALLLYRVHYALSHSWLKNYYPHPLILNRWKYYRIDSDEREQRTK